MRIAAFIAISLIATGFALPAAAQGDFCGALQSELASLGGGDNRALRAQLADAREDARRNNCGGGLFRKKGKACGQINSRINRLERQLSSSRRGGFFFGRAANDRDRDRILRAMARAGCSPGSGYAGGGYRTLCVRVCDGYYFPLSFSTKRQRLQDDAARCLSQYGPGEATLYYHSSGSDSSQAVSLDNERYADQPYAFAYRQAFYPQCQARLERGLALLGERVLASLPPAPPPPGSAFEKAVAGRVPTENIPLPIARQNPAEDPDTLANRAGGFTPRVKAPVGAPVGPLIAGVDPSVRPVGEPYLFAEGNPGAPPTLPGYKPPELKDFRPALQASMLPALR
jgi:hypothetical protein